MTKIRVSQTQLLLCLFCNVFPTALSWVSGPFAFRGNLCIPRSSSSPILHVGVIDAEFESVKKSETYPNEESSEAPTDSIKGKTLFDLSLDADSDFKNTRIPFLDSSNSPGEMGTNYIDVKLAFIANLDGVQYGIGIPFDAAAAVTVEDKSKGTIEYLSPDEEENDEYMQIMATQLKEHVGDDLRLHQTPRVLTISGPIEKYTKDWKTRLSPKPFEVNELLDDSNEDLEFFHNFMKAELGEEEYEKTLKEAPDEELLNPEFLELFSVSDLGIENGNAEELDHFMKSLFHPEEEFEKVKRDLGFNKLENDGAALKLVSYLFGNGKSYSLVQLLQPYVLVGKLISDNAETRFELLTKEEERLIVPHLEKNCQQELEEAGLSIEKKP